jgi:DNA-binding SARP family transcriptional activator
LCATALEHGIETAFVQRMIRAQGILPPNPAGPCPDWPWEIRITTLGRFAIERDGQPLPFPGKAPWKVLLMLKALIAAGPHGIEDDRLADCLWPEADGDTARLSLDTTLHRLRQLLGPDGLVTLRNGRLALDGRRCWVDAHAFELRVESSATRQAAVSEYQGDFLAGLDAPWAEGYRERLRGRFVKAVLALGKQCENGSDFNGAIAWYERGLAEDPLAESLYRQVMICHRANGSAAEGLRSFERCRKVLRDRLDSAPSPETAALGSALRR